MPTQLISEAAQADNEPTFEAFLQPETDDLTLEAQVLTGFLTTADFSPVWAVEAAVAEAFDVEETDEDGTKTRVQVMPGWAAAGAIDEDDLGAMFEHYLGQLQEAADADDATLEDKARVAAFADLLDEKSAHKRGWAKKGQKGGVKNRNNVVRQMLAMIHKGVLKRSNGGYEKGPGYQKGGTTAGKNKVAKYKGANVGKVKRAAKKAGMKAESWYAPFDIAAVDESPVWGLGEPVGSALYSVSVAEDATARVADLSEKFGKKGKGKKGKMPVFLKKKMGDEEETNESRRLLSTQGGIRRLDERREAPVPMPGGPRLAGRMLSIHEGRNVARSADDGK